MVYERKTWKNVPNPDEFSPEELASLPRFDEDNMNRIEEGIEEALTSGAIGKNATVTSGGAIGSGASANEGGSVGNHAVTTSGGAVGNNAKAGSGFAGGSQAKTIDADGNVIDAIQLGQGTNNTQKTLQVYDYQMMKADGTIPDERMPTKAPAGHGIGTDAPTSKETFLDIMKKGCGFRQIENSTDSPDGSASWISLMQAVRYTTPGSLTGAQLAFRDSEVTYPTMWMRTVAASVPKDWVEMLHSGNISKLGVAKIQTGTYTGTGVDASGYSYPVNLSFNFTPKYVFVKAVNNKGAGGIHYHGHFLYNEKYVAIFNGSSTDNAIATWGNTTLEWKNTKQNYAAWSLNEANMTYSWIAIG